jgi:CheY-like chemotaxis protein
LEVLAAKLAAGESARYCRDSAGTRRSLHAGREPLISPTQHEQSDCLQYGTEIARSSRAVTTMMPESDHFDASVRGVGRSGGSRLNLLLSCAGWRQDSAFEQLPALLSPMGIQSIKASSGDEAADAIRQFPVHIAVVDLAIPMHRVACEAESRMEAGPRILQLLRRLDQPPPTVVVRPPQPATRESARGLTAALREGAFAVLDQPVHLEHILEVLRRILRRYYADVWPA